MSQTTVGPDGKPRCRWCAAAPEFLDYHDKEWGFPVSDDFKLFEKLSFEGFQSGLSWRTILAKREHFRKAFQRFDYNKLATFTAKDVDRLLQDEGIVRHRGKIEAVINNATGLRRCLLRAHSLHAASRRGRQRRRTHADDTLPGCVPRSLPHPHRPAAAAKRARLRTVRPTPAGRTRSGARRTRANSRRRTRTFERTAVPGALWPNT